MRIVWHDTAERRLAEAAVALSEQRGWWRLERLRPDGAGEWWPAKPAPVLAEAGAIESLPDLPAGPLVPIAAFEGRSRRIALHDPNGPASLTLLEGRLRGVTAEAPCCRLTLEGEATMIAGLALRLAETWPITVPRASLAAAAAAVASGVAALPRRLGAPAVPPQASVQDAFAGIVAHLAEVILHWSPRVGAGRGPEAVHQMRVAVRRLRSALSVFRRAAGGPACEALAAELRALAGGLGEARDWDVFLAGTGAEIAQAFAAERRVAALLEAATRQRQAAYLALAARLAGPAWRRMEIALALLPGLAPWAEATEPRLALLAEPCEEYAAKMLTRRLRHVTAIGEDLSGQSPEALHELRKQAKRLRYAAEFFAPLFAGKTCRRFLDRMATLQEALGRTNDAATATSLIGRLDGAGRGFATGVVQGYLAAGSAGSDQAVARAWRKFYRQEAFWE